MILMLNIIKEDIIKIKISIQQLVEYITNFSKDTWYRYKWF